MEDKKKSLGLLDLTSFGLGGAIGSGIFVMLGMGILKTGRSIVLALFCGCIIVTFAYLYNILISATFPLRGGNYAQVVMLQPPVVAGFKGVMGFLMSMNISMYGLAIVDYASDIFPSLEPYATPLAIGIQTFFFLTTIKGSKFMARMQNFMVVILALSLILYIVFGLPQVKPGVFAVNEPGYFLNGADGFFSAIGIMMLACMGANAPVDLTADARNPKKNVPLSIILTTLALAVIYGLMAIVASGVLPVEEVAGKSLAVGAKEIFPYPIYMLFILGGACFAIATTLYTSIATIKYPSLVAIEDGWLPAKLGVTTKSGYPWLIMLLCYIISLLPTLTGMSLDTVVSYLSIPNLIICSLNNVLFLTLPKKYPTAWKNSYMHMPFWALTVLIVLATGCDIFLIYRQFANVTLRDQVIIVVMVVVLFLYSAIRFKTGKVTLNSRKEALAEIEAYKE